MYPDISNYKHVTDWSAIKATCPFIICRATQGTGTKNTANLKNGVDIYLDTFINGCEKHGIPYWLYAFLEKGNEKAQAEFLVKTCKGKIDVNFVGYILDIEDNNKPADVMIALEWLTQQVNKTMIYTGYGEFATYRGVINSKPANCAWWEARYGKDTGDYSEKYPCHEGVDLHQFTSQGTCPGISEKVDLSRLTGLKPEAFFTGRKREENMAIIFGSARISEKGTISGARGDQKQKNTDDYAGEVSMEKYYTHKLGWTCLRAKDAKIAEKLAYAMKAMCNNKQFGYSQPDRLSGYNAAAAVGFDPAKVTTPCNIDCSEAVRTCLAYAGIKVADFITSNEAAVISATGRFETITKVTEGMLRKGDILVTKTKGHTVIVVEGPGRETAPEAPKTETPKPAAPKPAKNVKATEAARSFSRVYSKTMTTTGDAHIRNGAGVSKKSLGVLLKGTSVRCYGYYTPAQGTKWFYVTASANGVNYTGFVSGKMLK